MIDDTITVCTRAGFFSSDYRTFIKDKIVEIRPRQYLTTQYASGGCWQPETEIVLNTGEIVRGEIIEGGNEYEF